MLSKGHDGVFHDGDTNSCGSLSEREITQEEMAILKKLEAQNRLLEADSKSLKSLSSEGGRSTSRRSSGGSASPTSIHSIHSINGQTELNQLEDDQWTLWGHIIDDWDDYRRKREKQLKEHIRKGIPHHFRGIVWQYLCGAHGSPIKSKYAELLKMDSPSANLIRRDIARTYPDNDFFKDKIGQEVLFNVTKAYSLLDREVGYCQGSAFIAGLLLLQMPEEEAFAVFAALMKDYRLRELFKPSMAELGLCMFQLDNMLQDHAPNLYTHFQAQGFHTSMYASSWFLTLFATTFSLQVTSRIMDIFMSEGMEIIFRIGLAMLLSSQQQLLRLDMEGMLTVVLKTLPEFYNRDPDLLFSKAYAMVKYNPKKMKKLEKEYMTLKTKQMEEQVEMRRLRTENRLLRQRVEALEKENGSLADKLIQDSVSRALEAEEKIRMGKELSIAKRQVGRLSQSTVSTYHQDNPFAISSDGDCGKPTTPSIAEEPSHSLTVITAMQPQNSLPQGSVSVPYSEEFVLELQQELVQARLREAESTSTLADLQEKISVLEKQNKDLTDESKVAMLQEELIAVKLREAEATGALKQLQQKFSNLQENWQSHLSRTGAIRKAAAGGSKLSKAALQELQEELLSAKFRETQLTSQTIELSQKVMELETSNQICTSQLRRANEERTIIADDLEKSTQQKRTLQQQLNELHARMAQVQSKSQESIVSMRFKEADNTMEIAELKQKIQYLESKCSEMVPASSDGVATHFEKQSDFKVAQHPDTVVIVKQLQEKILEQQKVIGSLRKYSTRSTHVKRLSQDSSKTGRVLLAVDNSDTSDAETDGDDKDLIFDSTLTDPDKVLSTDIKISLPPPQESPSDSGSMLPGDMYDSSPIVGQIISPPRDFQNSNS